MKKPSGHKVVVPKDFNFFEFFKLSRSKRRKKIQYLRRISLNKNRKELAEKILNSSLIEAMYK